MPDHSATMVLLASREVPGEQMYLFAPDAGVPQSASHPFHVARFTNRSGALLERGPIAIFEGGAFLGQGMLDALPAEATATVPFALERGLTVGRSTSSAVEGARLVSMHRGELTIERFDARRSTFHVRNGTEQSARVMVREELGGYELFEPPTGSENSNGNALVPCTSAPHGEASVVVTSRHPNTTAVEFADEQGGVAVEQYLRDGGQGAIAAEVSRSLRAALDLRRSLTALTLERGAVEVRRDDLAQSAEQTRENLASLQGNRQAKAASRELLAALAGRCPADNSRSGNWSGSVPARVPRWFAYPLAFQAQA